MRRILTVLLLLAIGAWAAWLLLDWDHAGSHTTDPWRAIPDNSAIIISIDDAWVTWDRFTHTSQLWNAFEQIPEIAAAGRTMARTMERMQDDAALRNALTDASMLLCLLPGEDLKSRALLIGTSNPTAEIPIGAFTELLGSDAATRSSLLKGEIVQVRPDTALPPLSFCLRDRMWLLSTSVEVMDEALLQLSRPSTLLQDSLFLAVRGTVGGGADAHVLAHLRRTAQMRRDRFDPPLVDGELVPDGWAALDVKARPDAILLSGLLAPAAEYGPLASIRARGSGRLDIQRVLPAGINAMDVWHAHDEADEYTSSSSISQDGADAFSGWIDGTVGLAWAEKEGGEPMEWAIFQTGDIALAVSRIGSLCEGNASCIQQEYRGNVLQQLPTPIGLAHHFGDRYPATNSWWTILGDMVLLSPDPDALRSSIDAWTDGNLLATDPRAIAWEQHISSTFGQMAWIDVARSRKMIKERAGPQLEQDLEKANGMLDRIGITSLQITAGQHGYFHLVAGIQHAPLEQNAPETGVLWKVDPGAVVERSPFVVRNHTNNTNEILVQDVEDRIHLIGSTGKLLWSRQLDGPIMGEVHQIDRFRNGKHQLLINTEERLYLIDRNGKNVGDMPVRLREKAATPLAVVDYEKDRDHRILVPTVEGRLLNYGSDGREVKGWEVPDMNIVAASPVQHLRIKNKDYLVFADTKGNVHILDRRGKVRERTALRSGPAPRVLRIVPGSDIMTSSMIWKDTASAIQQGSFDGSIVALSGPTGEGSTVLDMDRDGKYELLLIHNDTLTITGNGAIVLDRSFGGAIEVQDATVTNGTALSVLVKERQQIILIDEHGMDIPRARFEGTVVPVLSDLNLDRALELITVNAKGEVVAYSTNIQ